MTVVLLIQRIETTLTRSAPTMARKIHPPAPDAVAAAAAAYALARSAFEIAESAKADAAAALMEAMVAAALTTAQAPDGVVGIRSGRRTVSITCKALAAEIDAIKERAVRTGRAAEKYGAPYVVLS